MKPNEKLDRDQDIAVAAKLPWQAPVITSFDAVDVTQSNTVNPGDALSSLDS
jgi:hypothetical protein